LRDTINDLINFARKNGASFMDIRVQKSYASVFVIRNKVVESARDVYSNGAGIRVIVNGAWGFATVNKFDKEDLIEAVKNAISMAKGASNLVRRKVMLADIDIIEDKVKANVNKDPANISPEEKLEYSLEVNKTIFELDKRVKSAQTRYSDEKIIQIYASSEGTYIEQEKIYVYFGSDAMAAENGIKASAREGFGSVKGYDIIYENEVEKFSSIIVERLKKQLEAKVAKGGVFPAVIGPKVIGLFTHEAFGHLSEADLVISGAVTSQKLGQKVASDIVTIIDDGTLPGAFGSFVYDDEGVRSQKTIVVKDGVLVSLLYDRELAKAFEMMIKQMSPNLLEFFNVKPTGNSRAESFRVPPIIRMRNTYIEPRDYTLDELIEDIKFGYYLVAPLGGQANLDGTFQGGTQEAYEIINGEIKDPIRNVSFSGNTLETLMKIDAIGKDFDIRSGFCGKGQTMYVGIGGPHVRVKEMIIGGGA